MSFCAEVCCIFGRIKDASEEALEDAVLGALCSQRMVVPWEMQELLEG